MLKEFTHCAFSVGASLYLLSRMHLLSAASFIAGIWLSFSVNLLIDVLGHTRTGVPSRTRLTHSVFTAPLWGASTGYASYLVVSQILSLQTSPNLVLWVSAGVLTSLGHLFLDSMTQAGVYSWNRRMAVAHFKYDNPALNAGFVLTGVALSAMAILQLAFS